MFYFVKDAVRQWAVDVFANSVKRLRSADDRLQAIRWLGQSRDIVASELSVSDKIRRLSGLVDSRSVVKFVAARVTEAVQDYRHSNLPTAVKVAIPATLAAVPLVGGQAAGLAAFGGAIGVPILLLVFLGAAGITSIIEAIIRDPAARPAIAEVIDIIIKDERLRETSWRMKAAMRERPVDPVRFATPQEGAGIHAALLKMDPFQFERHVMSFFESAGCKSWVTQRSNDLGVDGFALHPKGLIVTQCKRNSLDNRVGRPVVQQFKGVIEEQNAFHGFIVTTSSFSEEARRSAVLSGRITLVDSGELVSWHLAAPRFDL